jgi:glycerol-1-phosphate dehydrogenase [NAD(P)+]
VCPDEKSSSSQPVELPHDLESLLGLDLACSCGVRHTVSLRKVACGPKALLQLPDWLNDFGQRLSLALVVDSRTRQVAGERTFDLLNLAGHRPYWCPLPDGPGAKPHADEKNLARVKASLAGADLAIAVGSGTLNDLTKLSSYQLEKPYIVVATAPSMNGYTSAIAAINIKGIKRTLPCHQPYGVVADLDVLAKAPVSMWAAGLGDLLSKPVASADFRLAGRLRSSYFCKAPEQVVLQAEAKVSKVAQALGASDLQALSLLTEALLLSGISMKLAGSSAPASGGEHLMSHYWDMTAGIEGRSPALHGTQVGVATIVSAQLYQCLAEVDPQRLDAEGLIQNRPSEAECRARIKKNHGSWAHDVEKEYLSKRLSNEELRLELETIAADWESLWVDLNSVLRPARSIRECLQKGGGVTQVSGLGLTALHLKRAFLLAREIRGRFCVLDLAAELGLLEKFSDRVLAQSGCLG